MIEEALADARMELASLRSRQAELEAQIAEAEAALGGTHICPSQGAGLTLHDALAHVLRESDNKSMSARDLADTVNERGLYRKRDGSRVEANQIQARVNNHDAVFEKDGPLIRLREESPMLTTTPQGVTFFRDDDTGFFAWLNENPDGYFINTERNPNRNSLVLHRSPCPHFTGTETLKWTKNYVKPCSLIEPDLRSGRSRPSVARSRFAEAASANDPWCPVVKSSRHPARLAFNFIKLKPLVRDGTVSDYKPR